MRILLIYPPTTVYGEYPSSGGQVVPLGLAYIAAVCEANKYETKIFDFAASDNIEEDIVNKSVYYGTRKDEIKDRIKEYNPDIVGIQCMYTAYAQDAYDIAKIVKDIRLDTLVVMGGAHASSCYDAVLANNDIDITVIGEGEQTFIEIVKRYEKRQPFLDILGTAVRKNGIIFKNPPRPLIDDIDSIPFPARHLLPLKRYMDKVKNPFIMRPHTFVITSRGCPYNCKFCSIKSVWGRTWRYHSPKRVADEIESVIKEFGVGEIHFVDDNISTNINRLIKICDEIIERKIDIKWTTPNGIAIWTLNKEALTKMKKSGCYRLTFGIESASEETRAYIRKRHGDLVKLNDMISFANKLGIWTVSTFIIGFPNESKGNIEETIQFALKSDLDFAAFFLPMPFPDTDLTLDYQREGLLKNIENNEWGKFLSGTAGVSTKYFSVEELRALQKNAYFRFIRSRFVKCLNPLRILNKIKSWEDICYSLNIGKIGTKYLVETVKQKGHKIYRASYMRKGLYKNA